MTINQSAVLRERAGGRQAPSSLLTTRFRLFDLTMRGLSLLAGSLTAFLAVGLLGYLLVRGLPAIDWTFLSTSPSALNKTYGILPNIINTVYMIVLTLLISAPLGVGAAIYLNEYARRGPLVQAIEFTTEPLAGIPSIIYGLFGYICFGSIFSYSILTGTFTLSIMVLPTIIRTTQEALRAVPTGYREGAAGLGATKWHLIRTILLPCCKNGIITACILSVGRIAGESAALIFTAGIGTSLPRGILRHTLSSGATLTVQLYQYADRGLNDICFGIAAILVLLVLALNLSTRLLAGRTRRED